MSVREADRERYLAKIDIRSEQDCWPWLGCKNSKGYGQLRWHGKTRNAIRAGWEVFHGEMPGNDMDVCHKCDNPPCQNPSHLFLGTRKENLADMRNKGRGWAPPRVTNAEQDAEIQRLLDAGIPGRRIARELNISRWVVSQIALNRRS